MSIQWPSELVSALARRRSVVVLGSGISRQAVNAAGNSPPTWKEFLSGAVDAITAKVAIKDAIRRAIRTADYLLACQMVQDAMSDAEFSELLRGAFLSPQFQAAPIHDSIIHLDSRVVATPNFDKIYDTRVNTVQNNSVTVKSYYDSDVAQALRARGRLVLKVHGTIDAPGRTIFTRQEYAKARQQYAAFYSILEALAVTHTFLFLGCGLSDPDTQLLLEDYSWKHQVTAPHYFVLPSDYYSHVSALNAMAKSLNIRVLTYDPVNNHEALKPGIDDLVQRVDAERQALQISADW
jgi:hypothetical protein